eukprot:14492437-Alexandrium_andersonii.AAC.1
MSGGCGLPQLDLPVHQQGPGHGRAVPSHGWAAPRLQEVGWGCAHAPVLLQDGGAVPLRD